jgi:hypothetical protein
MPRNDEPIVFLRENCKKVGAESRERYERYKNSSTVSEAISRGATKSDLGSDLRNGFIIKGASMIFMPLASCVRQFASNGDEPIGLQQTNPKKQGTQSWQRYELYKNATTIREAKKAGIWPGDLRNDLARGFLQFGHLNHRTAASGHLRPAKISGRSKTKTLKAASKKGAGCVGSSCRKLKRDKPLSPQSSTLRTARLGKKSPKAFTERILQLPWSKKLGWVS